MIESSAPEYRAMHILVSTWSASCVPFVNGSQIFDILRMGVIKYRFLKFHSSPKVPHLKVPFLPLTESGPMADIEIE